MPARAPAGLAVITTAAPAVYAGLVKAGRGAAKSLCEKGIIIPAAHRAAVSAEFNPGRLRHLAHSFQECGRVICPDQVQPGLGPALQGLAREDAGPADHAARAINTGQPEDAGIVHGIQPVPFQPVLTLGAGAVDTDRAVRVHLAFTPAIHHR